MCFPSVRFRSVRMCGPESYSCGEVKDVGFKRVMVLGFDGFDPNILEHLMGGGLLPNFSRLSSEGTFSRLQTSVPPESPVAWLCAATGVNPGRHGVFDFIGRDPRTYLPRLSILRPSLKARLGLSLQAYAPVTQQRTFWDILSKRGVNVSVIRWPLTFPPRAVNGRLVSGLGTPDVTGTLGRYTFYTTSAVSSQDKAADRVVTVSWQDGAIEASLVGPPAVSLTKGGKSSIPLRIERQGNDALNIRVGDAPAIAMRVGEWSDWIGVRFPVGLSRTCPAMLRMYASCIAPELALYVSPLQIDPLDPAIHFTYPPELSRDLAERIGRFHTLGLPEDAQAARHGRIPLDAFLEQCNEITREREQMFEQMLAEFESGLLAIVFDACDRIQHMFWGSPGRPRPHAAAPTGRTDQRIAEHYQRMDRVVGRALQAAKEDTAVFVLSDHGFTYLKRTVHLNTWLVQNGFMTLQGSSGSEGAPLLKSVNWWKTKAYAAGFCSCYLNVRGRERKGIIRQGRERDQTIEELSSALGAWRDPQTGEAVVRTVYAADKVYWGEHVREAPELIIGYSPGYRASWQTALGAAPSGDPIVDNDDLWAGDHLVDAPCVPGIFLSNVRCAVRAPRLIDLAPTVLKAFGFEQEGDMDGKPLL